jgi:AcrR family transcriptional regulator
MSDTDVKSLIVESATKYFSKFGFYKTTMDEIAKHIHKAKGILYYYFKSKEELFNEVLKQELGAVKAELSKIVNSDKDSLITLKDYMLTRLKLLHRAVNYHETLKADFFEKYHFVKDVRDDFAEFERTQLTTILKKGKKEGYLDVKNINSTVNIIIMVVNGIEIPLFLQNKYSEFENTIDELATMIVNSLKTQKK